MLYDVFICHASEDKESFVRPLAETLRERHVEVWYDEFSLTLGDSIRRAIDNGLRQSRFAIVVFSPSFFAKQWPQHELDGLFDREASSNQKVILSIWHGIGHDEVAQNSPLLAGKLAVSTARGLDHVVSEILRVVKPQGSPLLIARDELIEWGVDPPVVTDTFWLKVVEASNRVPSTGAVPPEESTWSRWSFPLPEHDEDADKWGLRLTWTALQLAWTERADEIPITELTPPEQVIAFIESSPGLFETCLDFPDLAAEYAPQLSIPGLAGRLEDAFEADYTSSPRSESWTLRHALKGHEVDAQEAYWDYLHGGLFGPDVSVFQETDHLIWLLSKASQWLPEAGRSLLFEGIITRPTVWGWLDTHGRRWPRNDWPTTGAVLTAIERGIKSGTFRWTKQVVDDWSNRIAAAVDVLGLPEQPDELLSIIRSSDFMQRAIEGERQLGKRRSER